MRCPRLTILDIVPLEEKLFRKKPQRIMCPCVKSVQIRENTELSLSTMNYHISGEMKHLRKKC